MIEINIMKVFQKNIFIDKNKLLKEHIKKHHKKTITLEELFNHFKTNKLGYFDTIFDGVSFKCLTIGNFNTIKKIKEKIRTNKAIKENKYIQFIFNYTNLQSNKIKPFFEDNLLISTCYYCNIDFINTYNTRSKKRINSL